MLKPAVGRVLKRPHHPLDVILICLRWYVADRLSLRSLDDMMAERGVSVDHSTVQRWAIKSRTKIRLARLRDRHVFGRQHSGCQGIGKVGAAWLSRTSFEGHVRPQCRHASWPERRCQCSGRCRDRPLAAVARRSVAPGFGRVCTALWRLRPDGYHVGCAGRFLDKIGTKFDAGNEGQGGPRKPAACRLLAFSSELVRHR